MLKIVLNVLHTVAERKSGEAESEARSWGFGLSSVTNYLFNLGQTLQLYLSVLICEMGVIMTGLAISHDCFENGMRYILKSVFGKPRALCKCKALLCKETFLLIPASINTSSHIPGFLGNVMRWVD